MRRVSMYCAMGITLAVLLMGASAAQATDYTWSYSDTPWDGQYAWYGVMPAYPGDGTHPQSSSDTYDFWSQHNLWTQVDLNAVNPIGGEWDFGDDSFGNVLNPTISASNGHYIDTSPNGEVDFVFINHHNGFDAVTISAPIQGTGVLFIWGYNSGGTLPSSGTLTLAGNNTFSGTTNMINGFTLKLANTNALQDSTYLGGESNTDGGGTLLFDSSVTSHAFTFGGLELQTGIVGTNDITLQDTAQNPVALTVGGNNASTEYRGHLSGSGSFTKAGTGTLTLSGANTYAGPTTVSAGTLALGLDNAIPSGAGKGNVAVNTAATLDLAGHNLTVNGLNDGAGGGGTVDNTVASAVTLTVGGNDATSAFSGTLQNTAGTLSLTKIGAGTVTISGALNYGGRTTIQGGTLEAVGAGGIGLLTSNGGLDIQKGRAVLDYTGLIDPASLDPIANTFMQQARANGWVIDSTHPIGSTTAAADPTVYTLGWTDTVVGGRNLLTVMYTLCGDANCDGTVNGADLNTVLSNYNKTGMDWSQGDFNYDGTVNGADLNMVLSNYNRVANPVTGAVPEPLTLLLAAAGLAGLLAYAWRKRR